jgi:hypothetical protein
MFYCVTVQSIINEWIATESCQFFEITLSNYITEASS